MKVLITGICGFIGSNLAQRCLEEGWIVDGVDDLSNGRLEFLPEPARTFMKLDFSDDHVLSAIRQRSYDAVFHLAALPRVSYSVEHPVETNDVNVTKTLKLLDACKGNVPRFVFASSSSVYGGAELLPTPDNHPKNPKSPYALQKSIVEDYLKLWSDLYGLDSVSLRFFNVYGQNCLGTSPYSTAISAWLTSIKSNRPLRFDGDGSQSRDMCHVDNVVDACFRAAVSGRVSGAMAFNVGCGDRTTNLEIFQYLRDRYPKTLKIDAPTRAGDVLHTQADISRTQTYLGYEPLVRIHEGLARTCDWYDSNWEWISKLK